MPGLEEKIKNKTVKLGVVGLGYVGLPLALAFAEAGFRVLGFDVQQKRVDLVNQGKSYIADVSNERLSTALANGALEVTTDQSRLSEVDSICICVPTPLTKTKEPDLASKAMEYDFHTRFIDLAAEINERMPYYVASRIMEALNAQGESLNGAKVMMLGVGSKKDD